MTTGSEASQGAEASRRARVVLVDDHPITRRGVRTVLAHANDYEICGETGSLRDALALVQGAQPDVVVTGLSLRDDDGRHVVQALHQACPAARVLVFSLQEERFFAARALQHGAHGYLMKGADTRELLQAVRAVTRGERYVSGRLATDLLSSRGGRLADTGDELLEPLVHGLTTRQRQILCLLKDGYGTVDVARHLGVSIKTIETHCSHIKERFGLKTARELLCFAASTERCQDEPA